MFVDNTVADIALRGVILTTIGLAWVVLMIRIVGLRSFSKMTNFDFVMTVAVGSLLSGVSQVSEWSAFAQAMIAIAALFVVQYLVARTRKASDTFQQAIQNDAVLLMRDGEFCEQAMKEERVDRSDLVAKLREANVLELSKVRAVVLETTGDVSVMHGDVLEDVIIENVRSVD